MKAFHLLAMVACLFWIAGAMAAEPKAGRDKVSPHPAKARAGHKHHAKAGGLDQASKREKVLQEFDANGNGKLDADEQVAARKAAAERRKLGKQHPHQAGQADPFNQQNGIQPLGGPPQGAAGPRGDGRAKMMERFDLNRDGVLSPGEQARALQFMQQQGGPGARGGHLPQMPMPQQGHPRHSPRPRQ